MNSKLIKIGNSRGVRIPKPLLEEAGLEGEVRLRVVEGGLLVEPVREARASWGRDAALLRERGEDGLVDPALPTAFDESEWEWE